MAKQKVVIKLFMKNARKRSKALKAAAGMYGIISASIDGNNIVVEGDGIDSVDLTTVLRKKLGDAYLISVTTDKKEEKKEDKSANPVVVPYYHAVNPAYPYQNQYAYQEARYPDSCSIM